MKIARWIIALPLCVTSVSFAQASERCEVWDREASFAASVADSDAQAFAAHLHPSTVFGAGSATELVGKEAVLEGWSPVIANEGLILRWRPEFTSIADGQGLAYSSGPYAMTTFAEDGAPRYAVGRFTSVWQRDENGDWYVVFDGAGTTPRPVESEADLAAHLDEAPDSCPY